MKGVQAAFFLATARAIGYNRTENRQEGCETMLTSVEGYYDGRQIVMDERVALREGQRVIITILEPVAERAEKAVHLAKYMGRGEKMFKGNTDDYVKELRADDRLQ